MKPPLRARPVWLGLLAALALPRVIAAQAPPPDRAALQAAIDSIALAPIRAGTAAGMSIAVVRGEDPILMRGYGSADLEFAVPMPDRAIYEIGSLTKQFTAAAILQLVEQGLVRLDADITDYLPDYPTRGVRISIRRLLDHTSGIPNFTGLPDIDVLMRQKLPPDSIVAAFKDLPLDFQPGDGQSYSNSGYFLLGLVIEQVSGQSYADYVSNNLFRRAGMTDSRYCSENAVMRRRAHGYAVDSTGFVRAAYLDHTWPFSAGSLCSTVEDLVAWTRALHHGGILGPAALREMTTPDTLNDGTRLRYAKGLSVTEFNGHLAIAHMGGINGFMSQLSYFPEADLTIAVLVNTEGPTVPEALAAEIADLVLPPRPPRPQPLDIAPSLVTGVYRRSGANDLTVASDSLGLTVRVGSGAARRLIYAGNLTFLRYRTVYRFLRVGDAITAVRRDAVYSNSLYRKDDGTTPG